MASLERSSKVARVRPASTKENHAPVSFEGTASDLGAMMAGFNVDLSAAKAAAVRASGASALRRHGVMADRALGHGAWTDGTGCTLCS